MNKFRRQLQEADVIYFRGGETQKIVETIKEIKDDFLSLIDGKIYAGSSAGVMFLSDYSMSSQEKWQKWLGLLPINSIVHYSPEKHQAIIKDFINQNPNSKKECVLLPETEFLVREY